MKKSNFFKINIVKRAKINSKDIMSEKKQTLRIISIIKKKKN